MSELLEVNHVSYAYHSIDGETETLADISFHIKEGEFAAIVGPSGCGKSTMLRCINALEPIQGGEIKLNGEKIDPKNKNIAELRRRKRADRLYAAERLSV